MMPGSLLEHRAKLEAGLAAGELLLGYEPNPGGQELLDRSQKHEIIFSGANDAGKTYSGLRMLACHLVAEKDINGDRTGFTIHPHRRIRIPRAGMECWISCWSEKIQIDNIKQVYEKLLAPFETKKQVEGGARKWAEFGEGADYSGRIDFKWQAAGENAYRGPKKHFILCDEPHKKAIYNECRMRITKYRGTILSTLTPLLDEDSTGASLADIQWFWEDIIIKKLEHPGDYPERDVIFCKLEENAAHVDVAFHLEMMKGMGEAERSIRETGMILPYSKRACFDSDMLATLAQYLKSNPEEVAPEYGELEYDEKERDDFKVQFIPNGMEHFPDKPKGQWALKVWERPIDRQGIIRNNYYIGVDVAEGKLGGDYSCAYVRKQSGEMVACIHGHLSELELARQLYLLGMYYCTNDYKPAMLAIEVVSRGLVTQGLLLRGNDEFKVPKYGLGRIYHRPSTTDILKSIRISSGEPGWYTSSKTRELLIGAMRRGIVTAFDAIQRGVPCPIKDIGLIEEARRFVLSKRGKYEATPGVSFDDRLFAWSIAQMCIEQYTPRKRVEEMLEPQIDDDLNFYVADDGTVQMNIDGILNRARAPQEQELIY